MKGTVKIMKTIGMNIATRRRASGMTQEQVAEKMNVTAQAVSKWENDQASPDADTLVRLARLFGTSVDDLLTGSNLPAVAETAPENIAKRILHITVVNKGEGAGVPEVNVDLRVPAAVVDAAVSAGEAYGVSAEEMEIVSQMLGCGVIGDVVNTSSVVDGMETIVTISIEKGEDE